MANGTRAKVTTAPKGRPTPKRSGGPRRQRTFDSTFQWGAGAVGLLVLLALVYLVFFR